MYAGKREGEDGDVNISVSGDGVEDKVVDWGRAWMRT